LARLTIRDNLLEGMVAMSEIPALTRAVFLGSALVLHGCSSDALPNETTVPSDEAHCAEDARDTPASLWPAQPRVVVMGDLHSDIQATRQAFQLAGGTDENDVWIGGALTIVQLGDMIGRSDDERQVLDFLFSIRQQAEAAGGKVHLLVGNHEVMGARVDNQAVGLNPFPGYEDLTELDVGNTRLQILPEHAKKRGAALMSGGPYAKRFAELPTVLQLGETVYVHGGVVPRWAEYGLDNINAEVSHWLFGDCPEPDSSLGVDNGDRVMWTRQFSSSVEATDCALLEQSLAILGAKRMIVAHTVQSTITGYCDDKVWAVDVGMSRFYGGPIEVLEIEDDAVLTVLRR
jgi:Calcineurin-like phosphoesterase